MALSFYFYDIETSGVNPRSSRIMQFAGQRTDIELQPIGEPDNILIKLTPDTLPEPDAIMITGITPQVTLVDGITEAEFLKYFSSDIATKNTVFVGFNNIRFDDEFMRFSLWRNFYDAYEWQWKDGRSRWDLLDLSRMTRALRPDGINWPFASDGSPTNRLELLTAVNNLDHEGAHDALSDVNASIALARLIRNKQTKLFEYLLGMRDKSKVGALIGKGEPVVYTSGKYPSIYQKTTIAVMVAPHINKNAAIMYDLRVDPDEFTGLSPKELSELWYRRGKDAVYFPAKVLAYNKCPAVAPLSVLDENATERLGINRSNINNNLKKLLKAQDFGDKLIEAEKLAQKSFQFGMIIDEQQVDGLLYDSFVSDSDKTKMSVVRAASESDLASLELDFTDERLKLLLPLYKARNYPRTLNEDQQKWWENFKNTRLLDGGNNSRAAKYFKRIEEIANNKNISQEKMYLLEELKLYGESIIPLDQ